MRDRKKYNEQYYILNKEKLKTYQRQWNEDNREKKNAWQSQYYKDHREERITYERRYYKDNNEKCLQYKRDNPEIDLRAQKKLYKKMGITKYSLTAWTKVVRKGKNCSHCDSDKDLHSHHIFPKSKYNDLALNENNGVVLCDPCHKEHHMLNGVN